MPARFGCARDGEKAGRLRIYAKSVMWLTQVAPSRRTDLSFWAEPIISGALALPFLMYVLNACSKSAARRWIYCTPPLCIFVSSSLCSPATSQATTSSTKWKRVRRYCSFEERDDCWRADTENVTKAPRVAYALCTAYTYEKPDVRTRRDTRKQITSTRETHSRREQRIPRCYGVTSVQKQSKAGAEVVSSKRGAGRPTKAQRRNIRARERDTPSFSAVVLSLSLSRLRDRQTQWISARTDYYFLEIDGVLALILHPAARCLLTQRSRSTLFIGFCSQYVHGEFSLFFHKIFKLPVTRGPAPSSYGTTHRYDRLSAKKNPPSSHSIWLPYLPWKKTSHTSIYKYFTCY
jgi:hypothetical protein